MTKLQEMNETIQRTKEQIQTTEEITKQSLANCVFFELVEKIINETEYWYDDIGPGIELFVSNECEKVYPLETQELTELWFDNLYDTVLSML